MSSENEDCSSTDNAHGTSRLAKKQSAVSYSREFLLSFSELEICKKLPSDFDASILSEFEDAFHGMQERQRVIASSPLQIHRRNEYSSSPPTRGALSTYSRSTYGRWDTRSSGRSDRDSDSQSDKDSDPGRGPGNPSRRPWQSSEHDGLLGSGSFLKPSGYGGGTSASKGRGNDHYQLSRSTEPYHPPRPFKAAPHSRRETNDSFNDETFGSIECTSEDKVEQERQRRESFELMRKEQQKALQEKQRLNPEMRKVDAASDISVLLEDTKGEKKVVGGNIVLDESAITDSGKSTIQSKSATSRPQVPPGFANTIGEKNSVLKPLIYTHKIEAAKPEPDGSLLHAQAAKPEPKFNGTYDSLERQSSQDTTSSDNHLEARTTHAPILDKGAKLLGPPLSFGVSDQKIGMEDHILRSSSLSETHESFDDPEIIEISAKVSGSNILGDSNGSLSKSTLDKIFRVTLPIDASSSTGPVEGSDSKPDDTWAPNFVQSSKFAHWFLEEERNPGDDPSCSRPNDLLSLIVGSDKGRSQLSDGKPTEHFTSDHSHESSELDTNLMSSLSSKMNGIPDRQYESSNKEAVPSVITCEDLEQTILSEYIEKISALESTMQGLSAHDAKSEQPRRPVDNHASQHLLSLLQKGTNLNPMLSPHAETGLDKLPVFEERYRQAPLEESVEEGLKNNPTSGKQFLETLFGSAFMEELQSVEAPVSVQRDPVESAQTNVLEPPGLSFPLPNISHPPLMSNEVGQKRSSHQNDILSSKDGPENRSQNWLGISDLQLESNSSKNQINVNLRRGVGDVAEFQLPEEESLVVGDPLKRQSSLVMPTRTASKGHLSSNASMDIAEKLAAIGAVVKEEQSRVGSEGSPFMQGSYNRTEPEIPRHNLLAQASPSQFQLPPPMSHGRPLPFPLDSHPVHMNSHMKFMGLESMIHRDPSGNHQFPANMTRPPFPYPSAGMTGFNLPSHNTMLPQMQISGNNPPHPLHEYQRSTVLPHPGNQPTALMPELNSIQGFPFATREHNTEGPGMALPAPNINGTNHPEAFQRLLEMELRLKSKQIHPFAGHSQAMYGHELDMGLRYR